MENLEKLLQSKSEEHQAKVVYHLITHGEGNIPKEYLDRTIKYFEKTEFIREAGFIAEKSNDAERAIEIYLKNKRYVDAAGVAERAGMKDRANEMYIQAIKYSEEDINDNPLTKENSENMDYPNFLPEGGLINLLVNFLMNMTNRDKVISKNRPYLPREAIKRKEELIPGKKYINPRTNELITFICDIDGSSFEAKHECENSYTAIMYYADRCIEPYKDNKGKICGWNQANYLIPAEDD